MPTPINLKRTLMEYYIQKIREKKIGFAQLEHNLPSMLRNELLDILIEEDRSLHHNKFYEDLKSELLVNSAEKIDVNEDMVLVWDGEMNDRQLVRDIHIQFREPRLMYAILDTDEYEEPDDINIMSDCRKDLEYYTYNGTLPISEIMVDFYRGIKEHSHPNWGKIYKCIEKRLPRDEEDYYEPYEVVYGDY